jgi:hypothetical protein
MAKPSSRSELITYCKRQLGEPVLQINIDTEQVNNVIDDAVQFFQENCYNGIERMYLKHKFTADDVTRFLGTDEITNTAAPDASTWENRKNFIEVPDHVLGIQKVFGITSGFFGNEMWGFSNQYFLMDVFNISHGSSFANFDIAYYYQLKQYFETLDMVIGTGGMLEYRFNKRQDRLYLDIDVRTIREDSYLIIDCYRALDPDEWSQTYNDMFMKRYATALMKKQWGQNLIKYNNVQLPGGLTLNGRQLYEDAIAEIGVLEGEVLSKYALPPLDMIG